MEPQYSYWPYALKERHGRSKYFGALIRLKTPHGDGYSALHPWPSLGDLPLSIQLKELAAGNFSTPILKAAQRFAETDARARSEGIWLFQDLEIPKSHWHWDLQADPHAQLQSLHRQQSPAIKLKISPQIEIQTLASLREHLDQEGLGHVLLRLDANATLTLTEATVFLEKLIQIPRLRETLEFIEDPCPAIGEAWKTLKKFGVRLAADFENSPEANVRILKPARNDVFFENRVENTPFVVTSYLDHPLGIAQAAWCAAQWNQMAPSRSKTAGLMTHFKHEATPFHQKISVHQSQLRFEPGLGFGFDHLLESLAWKKLQA